MLDELPRRVVVDFIERLKLPPDVVDTMFERWRALQEDLDWNLEKDEIGECVGIAFAFGFVSGLFAMENSQEGELAQ